MQPRTKRQKEVLDYVTRFIERNGHKPSYQQIARHLGVSSRAGVQRHIEALESQGLVTRRRANGSFGIELQLEKIVTDRICGLELIEVAGENGRLVAVNRSVITIPRILIGDLEPDSVFAFKAPDDSMIDEQICEGDVLILEARNYARRGEVAVVETEEGQMLLGLYYQHGSETEVRPANADSPPIVLPADEVTVLGVMRGLMRFPSLLEQ